MDELIKRLGGADRFVRRLNYYHETQIQYIGDEQAFLLVYLYHYAGRPGLSASRAHSYIPTYFKGMLYRVPPATSQTATDTLV
jgi:putative alpha-1,2-mannosidase